MDRIKKLVNKRIIKEEDMSKCLECFLVCRDELIKRVVLLRSLSEIMMKFDKILNMEIKQTINIANGNILGEKRNVKCENKLKLANNKLNMAENLQIGDDLVELDNHDVDFDNNDIIDEYTVNGDVSATITCETHSNRLFKRIRMNLQVDTFRGSCILRMITNKIFETLKKAQSFNGIEEMRDDGTYELVENFESFEGTHLFSSSSLNSNIVTELESLNIFCFNEKVCATDRESKAMAFCKLLELLTHNKVTVEQVNCYANIYVYAQ